LQSSHTQPTVTAPETITTPKPDPEVIDITDSPSPPKASTISSPPTKVPKTDSETKKDKHIPLQLEGEYSI